MSLYIVLTMLIVVLIVSYFAFNVRIKKIKDIATNKKLDEISLKFPSNKELCKEVLKMLNSEDVEIKEENNLEAKQNNSASLYFALTHTIYISNISNSYTRIQTICHEFLHSIQPKKLLLFNFFYSNIYLIYYILSIVLTIFGVFKNIQLQIIILLTLSLLYYAIRSFLEIETMTKAPYIAKEYMIKYEKTCNREEINQILNKYDELNKLGIPAYNYTLLFQCILKIIIFIIIAIIKSVI